jgi:class 3 adenylate cyclase/tetratricopeptide (TPR) repeat protein
MVCLSCGTENRSGRKFCSRCAAPLTIVCPRCESPNEPGELFCGECATPLTILETEPDATATAPVAERRLVSVLFADLVGFTAWSAGRDPEDVRELLSSWFALAREQIERRGGTVEKFIGDAVMAAWGAPVAGEDDAEQTVLAALDVAAAVSALGEDIAARAGVMTGEVAVTVGAAGEGMVAGEVVNTAARLQAAAEPGAVLVGAATMLAASTRVAFEPVGDLELKGLEAPVPAWRAIGANAGHRERDRPGTIVPDLVGREAELDRLADLVAQMSADRRPRLVLVLGEAGVGKTRLARELHHRLASASAARPTWCDGHVPAGESGGAFAAWAEMVRAALGLADGDDDETSCCAVATFLDSLELEDADRRLVEPALLTLLGLAPPPPGGRDVLFAGWRIYLERLAAARGLLVLALDDLHEAAPDLLDFLDHLVTWAKGSPILVLGLARSELLEHRPAWREERASTASLRLRPLDADAVGRLLVGIVAGLPESLFRTVVERADGIPLYAVETLRMLAGEGMLVREGGGWRPSPQLTGIAVPATLRELIAARLDAAGPASRALLEDAAVLGVRFDPAALAAVSGLGPEVVHVRLADLVEREFLVRIGGPGAAAVVSHAFVHPLVREVAYATLSRADRRVRHVRAARHFAAFDDPDAAGTIASHYLAAHRASRAGLEADELAAPTRDALRVAGERALAGGAPDQAVTWADQALAFPAEPSDAAALLEIAAQGANLSVHRAAALAYAQRALACREAAGDPEARARSAALLSGIFVGSDQIPAAVAVLEQALAALPPGLAPEAEAAGLAHLSRAYMRNYEHGRAIETADRALALAGALGRDDLRAEALINKCSALAMIGRDPDALASGWAALRLADEAGVVWSQIRARANLGQSVCVDDLGAAVVMWREALDLATRFGNRVFIVLLSAWIAGAARSSASDWDGTVASLTALLKTDLEDPDRFDVEGPLIAILAARGELEAGQLAAHEALTRALDDPQARARLQGTRAEVAWCRGDFRVAIEAARHAADLTGDLGYLGGALRGASWTRDLALARELAGRLAVHPDSAATWRAMHAEARGAIAALEGRSGDAAIAYDGAIRRWRESGYDFDAASAALDFAWAVGPEVPEARVAAGEARSVFERVRANVYLERLDAALGLAPGVSSIVLSPPG